MCVSTTWRFSDSMYFVEFTNFSTPRKKSLSCCAANPRSAKQRRMLYYKPVLPSEKIHVVSFQHLEVPLCELKVSDAWDHWISMMNLCRAT